MNQDSFSSCEGQMKVNTSPLRNTTWNAWTSRTEGDAQGCSAGSKVSRRGRGMRIGTAKGGRKRKRKRKGGRW